MDMMVRLLIVTPVLSLLMFSYGMLYIRGRVGRPLAVLVGAIMGLAAGFVAAPEVNHTGAAIAATIIVVVVAAVVFPFTVGIMDEMRDRLTSSRGARGDSTQPPSSHR